MSERNIGPTLYKVSLTIHYFLQCTYFTEKYIHFSCYIYNYMLTPKPKPTLKTTHAHINYSKGISQYNMNTIFAL